VSSGALEPNGPNARECSEKGKSRARRVLVYPTNLDTTGTLKQDCADALKWQQDLTKR